MQGDTVPDFSTCRRNCGGGDLYPGCGQKHRDALICRDIKSGFQMAFYNRLSRPHGFAQFPPDGQSRRVQTLRRCKARNLPQDDILRPNPLAFLQRASGQNGEGPHCKRSID